MCMMVHGYSTAGLKLSVEVVESVKYSRNSMKPAMILLITSLTWRKTKDMDS